MTNITFRQVQPAQPRLPAIPTRISTITARIDGHPRNAKIVVALDTDRILIRCTDITLSRWITAHDIITPRRIGGAA